ncbi:MAG TPA: rRNA maturation RNase YbeY [Bryobacteraceae bacterium]|nr:rRNA maturation RNase YbeY [Bryobacteraceae bacterium]
MPGPTSATLLFQHPSKKTARRPLRTFFEETVARVAANGPVTCLITDDSRVRALNRQFRGKDYPTDVLSFPLAEGGGEIAISLDTATRQAADMGHAVEQELRILMLHGLLHLAGMDHETDAGHMARAEAKWRKRLGLVSGLIERGLSERTPIERGGVARRRPHR